MYFVKNGKLELRVSNTSEDIQTLATASSHFAQRSHVLAEIGKDNSSMFVHRSKKQASLSLLARVAGTCLPVRSCSASRTASATATTIAVNSSSA